MAVTKVTRKRNPTATFATGYRNEYKVEFVIDCDTEMFSGLLVRNQAQAMATGDKLPVVFQFYDYDGTVDLSSYVLDISLAANPDSLKQWTATVSYGKTGDGQTPQDQPPDPLNAPLKYWVEWIEEQRDVEKDRLGKAVANCVGDEFDTPLQEPELYPVLVIQKNYATIQEILDIGITYHRSVNSNTFFGGPKRTVKFMPIQSEPIQLANNISFYTATLRFAYNPATWDRDVPNKGFRYRPAPGFPPIQAMDLETKLPVAAPVNLAANGTLLPEGAAHTYTTIQILPEKDYADIFA